MQGTLTEDEALARAIQASLAESQAPQQPNQDNLTQEEIDRMTALALDQSLNGATAGQGQRQATGGSNDKSCTLS